MMSILATSTRAVVASYEKQVLSPSLTTGITARRQMNAKHPLPNGKLPFLRHIASSSAHNSH